MTQKDRLPAGTPALSRKRKLTLALCGVLVVAACVTLRYYWGAQSASAQPQEAAEAQEAAPAPATPQEAMETPAAAGKAEKVVAVVNGEQISRQELAQDCLKHYGKPVLEALVNKYVIALECQKYNVSVTKEEINNEIERYAKRFGLPVDQWMKMLKDERGINPAQYGSDIIWPMLALRKLAGERISVTKEELQAEFETQFGPQVKARIIMVGDQAKAQKLRAEAVANPADFAVLAKQSEDPTSASLGGLIQPIRRHIYNKKVEEAAFGMKDGEVSEVIPVGNQFAILQRESLIPAREVKFEQARASLEAAVRERKQHDVTGKIFQELQKKATVVNVMNDAQLSQQYPGVAAQINGTNVTVRELAERCIERHGELALEGTINRRLLEQALKRQKLTVAEADIDQEIARAASLMLPLKDGVPDVQGYIKVATEQQGVPVDLFRRDAVWPSVALKKLVGGKVQVADEDLQRGYENNYGPRVRCRAIVLSDFKTATKIWDMARKNPTVEFFGELAEKYSLEPGSRALKGQVPPIAKHSGRPTLEKEAFSLKEGQLSQIVNMDDKCVILFCEGYTVPAKVEFAAVRDMIYEDVHEKKLRIAMSDYFQRLQDDATVDNYLAGTSRAPKRNEVKATATVPARGASR